ncbi:MAG: hypothetical protein GX307_04025 [Euryarchaeota archaeon]|nr:hypothetical protein [Euryarchaeota archaeon]
MFKPLDGPSRPNDRAAGELRSGSPVLVEICPWLGNCTLATTRGSYLNI